jgi:hypothetical protein
MSERWPVEVRPRRRWRALGLFALTTFAVAIPYWWAFGERVDLPDALGGPMPPMLFAAGLFAVWRLRIGTSLPALAVCAAGPAAVMSRVFWDVAADPTAHNLWPFEVVLALWATLPGALIGVLAGWLLLQLWPPSAPDG